MKDFKPRDRNPTETNRLCCTENPTIERILQRERQSEHHLKCSDVTTRTSSQNDSYKRYDGGQTTKNWRRLLLLEERRRNQKRLRGQGRGGRQFSSGTHALGGDSRVRVLWSLEIWRFTDQLFELGQVSISVWWISWSHCHFDDFTHDSRRWSVHS